MSTQTIIERNAAPLLEAHEPPEARGLRRDEVRLLVGRRGTGRVSHHTVAELPELLDPGDVLVVNTSGTLPAAVDVLDPDGLVVHFSTALPDGSWLGELRRRAGTATEPSGAGRAGLTLPLSGGGHVILQRPYSPRLWHARVQPTGSPTVVDYLHRHGRPIRYRYVPRDWPLSAYQTVFAREPGSAEMPSAGRPFTPELVTRLVAAGVLIAPLTLHTGVASPEAEEKPYPEPYRVPSATARRLNSAIGRVIAVGTTVVRTLETVADVDGAVRPGGGWTDLVVTPQHRLRVVDGLLTGLHEPTSSHLWMLQAVAGRDLLDVSYAQARARGYLWHEFGDSNLLLP